MERQLAMPRRPGLAGRAAEAEVGLPLGRLKLLHCGYAVSPFALAGAAGTLLDGNRPQTSSYSNCILAKRLAHHPSLLPAHPGESPSFFAPPTRPTRRGRGAQSGGDGASTDPPLLVRFLSLSLCSGVFPLSSRCRQNDTRGKKEHFPQPSHGSFGGQPQGSPRRSQKGHERYTDPPRGGRSELHLAFPRKGEKDAPPPVSLLGGRENGWTGSPPPLDQPTNLPNTIDHKPPPQNDRPTFHSTAR
ncbi:hypothetical protein PGTUg99_018809 [Puccinia graminis f. sp. tritici]|uniref:Uncharacterized protein n=1 Tax=Puccinia graminis f. sp. tritici TaxID=56615 RepID=A0A5B0M2W5_PUCGR|nr:hypothetical protein PGTUg99_018809 [Puccinia graminis f. sp. tritici]